MIKFIDALNYYVVTVSARHHKTKRPHNLKRKGFKTLAEAKRAEVVMRRQLMEKFHKETHLPWGVVARECLEHLVMENGDTAYLGNLETVIRLHTMKPWGNKPIDEITPFEIKDLVTNKVGVATDATKKDILKHIRQVFDFAFDKGYIKERPYPKMKFKLNQKIFKTLNEVQVKLLLQEAWKINHPWKEIWATAVFTGMRNGEIYALKPEDIDFDMESIHVCRGYDRKIGYVDYTKGNYDRIVDLSPPLKRVFQNLMAEDPNREFLLPKPPEWDTFQQAKVLRKFLGEIGLPSIRFHDLRAAWCTILLNLGVDTERVKIMGGWKDDKSFRFYIRKSGIKTKGALKILDKLDWE
jgi:integrase